MADAAERSDETVGCASPSLWSGSGSPKSAGCPLVALIWRMNSRRRTENGTRAPNHSGDSWSRGVDPKYLGMIHAPRRMAMKVRLDTREVSTAMSQAELPMPSTSTFLPS